MKLAKPRFDVGLFTNQRDAMLAFWQGQVGLPYEELLRTGGGNHQHRHGLNGAVLKLNHTRDALPELGRGGYRELLIAREGLAAIETLDDPDGNRVTLMPPAEGGVVGIGVRVAASDADAHARFYREALGLEPRGKGALQCGDSLLFLEQDPSATSNAELVGRGYRYLTIQVFDCEAEHAHVLERGGREGAPPRRMGDVAIFSMVRDPDGNFIEI